MKREFTKLMAALAMLLFIAPLGMWGQTANVTLSDGTFDNNQITWTCADGNITITQSKGNSGTAVNSTYISAPRVYKGHILSFEGSGDYKIISVSITYSGNYYGNSMTAGTVISSNIVTDNTTDVNRTWATTSGGTHVVSSKNSAGLSAIHIQNVASANNVQLRPTAISISYTAGGATYNVVFNTDGGTFVPNNDFLNTSNTMLPGTYGLPNASKIGFAFNGWSDGSTTYQAGDSYTVSGDVTFTAQWTASGSGSTGTIVFGNNGTNISSASVTGKDDLNNTWTITTEGTTSFTQNTAYSQVGSSSNPATSITFTTTLPASMNITAFSAKFGGFSNTAGNVTLKVGNTTVGTGSLNGTNDVEVESTSQATGTVLTVTVTGISKGVKCYFISYTCASVDASTITFNPNAIDLGNVPVGQQVSKTFSVIQSNLSSNISLTASVGQVSPSTIQQGDGSTEVTWTYTPSQAGSINATITATSGALNPQLTITGEAKAVRTVTVTTPSNGTVTASPSTAIEGEVITLTATPANNYYLASLDVVNASTSQPITVTNNSFVMPDANVTVSATFGLIVPATVSFNVNGKVEMTATVNSNANVSIDMTKFVADVTTEGYLFDGWYTDATGGTKLPTTYTPSADVTVYAQFGEVQAADYTLVTSTDDLKDGNLVVITPQGSNNTAMSTDQRGNNRNATVESENHIIKSPTSGTDAYSELSINSDYNDVCELVLGKVVDGQDTYWTFYDPNYVDDNNNVGGYLYSAGANSNNYLKTRHNNSDANGEWAIAISNKTATVQSHGAASRNILKYNTSNKVFSSYASNSNGTQLLYLYTKTASKSAKVNRDNVEATSKVTAIAANVLVTVKADGIVYLTGNNAGNEANLVVEEGGQLVTSANVAGTMLKSIAGYTGEKDNYYLISSPLTSTDPVNVGNMLSNDYDLYYFQQNGVDQVDGEDKLLEWRNYNNPDNHFTSMFVGSGYLYANSDDVDLEFAGTIRKNLDNGNYATYDKNITYETNSGSDYRFSGWNLVGNPFPSNAQVNMAFYKMNSNGNGIMVDPVNANSVIAPMEGVFVVTDANAQVTFTATTDAVTTEAKKSVSIAVKRDNELMDKAIVDFNNGISLRKLNLSENATKVYFQQGLEEFAIVAAENEGELPVSFQASRNGRYTLSVNVEDLDMNYLHLIDNKTGNDVDLLATPSYTFEANTNDYTSRFRLVFDANAVNENDTTTTFAYFNGTEWVVNNPSTGLGGNATLQVVDMMGRVLSSQTISGNANININQAAGIYMLRLVNGENVMVQKVVVR